MTDRTHSDSPYDDLSEVPSGMDAELRALTRHPHGVAPRVDEAVRAAARLRMQELREVTHHRRWRPVLLRGGLLAAGAAALLMALWLRSPDRHGTDMDVALGDVDGSGRIDIVDAYLLARRLELGEAPGPHDLDGDGEVDAGDVAAVAAQAVRIPEEESR